VDYYRRQRGIDDSSDDDGGDDESVYETDYETDGGVEEVKEEVKPLSIPAIGEAGPVSSPVSTWNDKAEYQSGSKRKRPMTRTRPRNGDSQKEVVDLTALSDSDEG